MQKTDWRLSAIVAGFVAVLVGSASSVAIVFQAAAAAGASAGITASGVSFFGIASVFRGLVAGLVTTGWFGWRRSQR